MTTFLSYTADVAGFLSFCFFGIALLNMFDSEVMTDFTMLGILTSVICAGCVFARGLL